MAISQSPTTSFSLAEVDLFCHFARRSGGVSVAELISLFNRSRTDSKDVRSRNSNLGDQPNWAVVDYKKYARLPMIELPVVSTETGDIARALQRRHSCRSFGRKRLTIQTISSLLAFALKDRLGFRHTSRAYPSAGGFYGTEAYLVARHVTGLPSGVFHYSPRAHGLTVLQNSAQAWTNLRRSLLQPIGTPSALLVLCMRPAAALGKYGVRGIRFALMEAGATGQTLDLTATALGLATLWLGGFVDEKVCTVLGIKPLHDVELPVLVFAIGYPTQNQKTSHSATRNWR